MLARLLAWSGASGRQPNPSRSTSRIGRTAGRTASSAGFAAVWGGAIVAIGVGPQKRAAFAAVGVGGDSVIILPFRFLSLSMSLLEFIEKNWMLVATLVVSGTMLIWPFIGRRFSGARDIGTLGATQLINSQNPLLLDVRETKEVEGGKLPNAVHVPLSQLASRGGELA